MNSEVVSIIMPVYNGASYIREAIESVFAQTYPHWELEVIDDGSIDSTASIVNSYSDPRVRYFYQQNQGQAAALNQGLDRSRGEYVTTLDSDDWLTPDSLKYRVEFLSEHHEFDVAYGDGLYCSETGEELLRFSHHMPAGVTGDVFDTLIVSPFYGTGAAVLIRTNSIRQRNLRYDESIVWCQDWDFYIRMAENASFGFVPSVVIRYRLHSSGMTTSMPSGRRLESLIRLRKKALASAKFQSVTATHKNAFFYDFIVRDLHGRTTEQEKIFQDPTFKNLPEKEQARLLRLTALSYLDSISDLGFVKKWLNTARLHAPSDPKTLLASILFSLNPRIARNIIQRWQNRQDYQPPVSPFDLAAVSQKQGNTDA